jgi:hypothetical protein
MSVSGAGYELAVLVALREMSYFYLRFDLLSHESLSRINPHQRSIVRCAPSFVIKPRQRQAYIRAASACPERWPP